MAVTRAISIDDTITYRDHFCLYFFTSSYYHTNTSITPASNVLSWWLSWLVSCPLSTGVQVRTPDKVKNFSDLFYKIKLFTHLIST